MGRDGIAVFVLALLFFESIAYLIARKGNKQRPQAVEMTSSSLHKKRDIDSQTRLSI
jgi:hypothetical protein